MIASILTAALASATGMGTGSDSARRAAPPRSEPSIEMTLLRVDGSSVRGAVTRIDEEGVTMAIAESGTGSGAGVGVDTSAGGRRVPWSECLALLGQAESEGPDEGAGMMVLADGQRLPGVAEIVASAARWSQPLLGPIEFPNGSLRSISFGGRPPPPASADADVVLLRTGDRLEGFVSTIADPLPLEPRNPGNASLVPLASVASISFVTRDATPNPKHRRIWIRDGTVIDAAVVRSAGDGVVTLDGLSVPGATRMVVPLSAVRAISGSATAPALAVRPMATKETPQGSSLRYSVTPVARLRWPGSRPQRPSDEDSTGADRSAWPMGAPAVAFDGPAILRAEIDAPATLSALVRLPRDRRPHGRFELFVRSGAAAVGPLPFDDAHREHTIRIEVQPPAVEFEIVDVGGGAVQDGVVIELGVLIPRTESAATPGRRSDH